MPVVVTCECGHKLDGSSFIEMPDGSKRARCPECLGFVDIPAKTKEAKPKASAEKAPEEEKVTEEEAT